MTRDDILTALAKLPAQIERAELALLSCRQAHEHFDKAEAMWSLIQKNGPLVTDNQGYLWIDSAAELRKLREQAQLAMKDPEVLMTISLGGGPGSSRVLGCDLSFDYVRINGEYTT